MLNVGKADLAHFDALFRQSADPWATQTSRAEWYKRQCLSACLSSVPSARVLELGCGNGSNTRMLARRALTVDACDGSPSAVDRTESTVTDLENVTVSHLPLPARFPADRYEVIVIAELLYYLSDLTLNRVMQEIDRTLRPCGALLLCHHHRQFHDASQRQAGLHKRFANLSQRRWTIRRHQRTARWDIHLLGRSRSRS